MTAPMDFQTPEPFVPSEVNLRDFQFMPFDVQRFRDSDLVSDFDAEQIVAAIMLWSASWHQAPASSLPDNDKTLAKLAGYGKAVGDFVDRIRAGALHKFVKCTDGRFYHHVVAEKAAEGWNAKLKEEWKRACDRTRKANKERASQQPPLPALPMPPHPDLLINRQQAGGFPCWRYGDSAGNGAADVTERGGDSAGTDGRGRRKSRLKGRDSEGTDKGRDVGSTAAGAAAGPPRAGPEADDPVFGPYIAMMHAKGMSAGHTRNFLALMRQGYGDELVLEVLVDAQRQDITKPVPWIKKALEHRHARRQRNGAHGGNGNRQEELEARNRAAVQDWKPPEERSTAHAAG